MIFYPSRAGGGSTVEGTATPDDVKAGVTFESATASGLQTGNLIDRSNWSQTVTQNGQVTIPRGIHNGEGKVKVNVSATLTALPGANGTWSATGIPNYQSLTAEDFIIALPRTSRETSTGNHFVNAHASAYYSGISYNAETGEVTASLRCSLYGDEQGPDHSNISSWLTCYYNG